MAQSEFNGKWHLTHWYPNYDDTGEEKTEHEAEAKQTGNKVVFQSVPNDRSSYMLVRLSIDGDIATGTWHESTLHKGQFEGVEYSGAGQLIVSKDKKQLDGLWAGAGVDRGAGKPKIYTGRWELKRLD